MPTPLQQNLETWLAQRRAGRLAAGADWVVDPVPAFVERDLRKFFECCILAHGFARARCDKCGQDFLVAYSCKGRGVCPGCNTRRMVETAAHMVKHVFPAVAVRQWVVVFPKRLRYFMNHDATAGNTCSTMCAAVSTMRRVLHPAQPPHPSHEYATRNSCAHCSQRARANPCGTMP